MKCAVIGIGNVARRRYLPVLAAEPDIELGCCSRDIASARRGAEEFGGVVLDDLDAVGRWRPDVTIVVAPDTTHVAIVERLIEHAVPRILVEKPLAAASGQSRITHDDLRDGERLARLARERGIQLAMAYNYRHFAVVARARAEAERRGWSAPAGVTAATHYACLSHVIDLSGMFLGELDTVTALAGDAPRGAEPWLLEDRVVAFTATTGATGVLRVSSAQPWGDTLLDVTVAYPEGSIRITDLDGSLELYDRAEGWRQRLTRADELSRDDGYGSSFANSVRAYLGSVRADAPPPSSVDDGVAELRFHVAVARSIAEARPVRLREV